MEYNQYKLTQATSESLNGAIVTIIAAEGDKIMQTGLGNDEIVLDDFIILAVGNDDIHTDTRAFD